MSLPGLGDEAEAAVNAARNFAQNELAPLAEEMDVKGELPLHLYKKAGRLGLLGLRVPPAYGGSAAAEPDLIPGMLCNIELAKVCAGFVLSTGASVALFGNNVLEHGTEEQKRKYLPPVVSGDAVGCWALTEPEAGSDALGIRTSAVRDGGNWVVNGRKTFITNAPIADYFIVLARTSGEPGGMAGGTAFILERGMEGLSTGKPFEKMGMRCAPTGEIVLDNVRVPDSQVLGRPEKGFFDMMGSLDYERGVAGAINIGIAEACLEICIGYVKGRRQFGQPLAHFQLIQEKIAVMYRDIELARAYVMDVLRMIQERRRATIRAAVAKWFATEMATKAALEAIQILGGYGYLREHKVERYMRDAKLLEIAAGTNEINKLLIARLLLGKAAGR